MKKVLFYFFILLSFKVYATPDKMEVWFISGNNSAFIEKIEQIKKSKYFANNEEVNCTMKVGDDCFDPKLGIVPDPELIKLKEAQKKLKEGKYQSTPDKYLSDFASDSYDCDNANEWDIYCGKSAKKEKIHYSKLEIWIDTSRYMANNDFPDKDKGCYRRSFVERLKNACSAVDVAVFSDSIKALGDKETLCKTTGFLDQNRFIGWVKQSEAKRLIIILDKTFYTKTLGDFFVEKGAKVFGDAPKSQITAKDLLDRIDDIKKYCR